MDMDKVQAVLQNARSQKGIPHARLQAHKELVRAFGSYEELDPQRSLKNGCAGTLSALLKAGGVDVPIILGAQKLANYLRYKRGWEKVAVGQQQPGDVGVTLSIQDPPGADHIYLVLEAYDDDDMLIADNQVNAPHARSTHGQTPTEYFLRATESVEQTDGGGDRAGIEGGAGDGDDALVGLTPEQVAKIIEIAQSSSVAKDRWTGRGLAPKGYVKGMAVAFAGLYLRLKKGDPIALAIAAPESPNPDKDALSYYKDKFAGLGMSNAQTGPNTLRHVFCLLMGLGMRESSGCYCEGRDQSARNMTADTAEAGLFQTSWNARHAHPLMTEVFNSYRGKTTLLPIFKEGAKCSSADFENYGEGEGLAYQKLAKSCPAFAVEFTAIGVRHARRHWGPINERTVEILTICDALFKEVQDYVDSL